MRSLRTITIDYISTGELKGLVETYQEIAAGYMQKIRHETVTSREFTEGIARISAAVGSDLVGAAAKRSPKTAVIWVSANSGLFGDIIEKTLNAFIAFVRESRAPAFVLGETGMHLLRAFAPDIRATSLPFRDDIAGPDAISRIVEAVSDYEHIVIFFGKFQSIAVQNADKRVVSGKLLADVMSVVDEKERLHRELIHLYEPSPSIVSRFMADEIMNSVVEQTILEAQLGKYASRLMHLDEAMDHIGDRMTDLTVERRQVKKMLDDRKQRTMLAGMKARRGI